MQAVFAPNDGKFSSSKRVFQSPDSMIFQNKSKHILVTLLLAETPVISFQKKSTGFSHIANWKYAYISSYKKDSYTHTHTLPLKVEQVK